MTKPQYNITTMIWTLIQSTELVQVSLALIVLVCVRACVCTCVRVCVHACMCVCVCVVPSGLSPGYVCLPTTTAKMLSSSATTRILYVDPLKVPLPPVFSPTPLSLTPGNNESMLHFYNFSYQKKRMLYKWNHIVCNLGEFAFFTQHNSQGIYPSCFVYQ